jgi:hypothetical protein
MASVSITTQKDLFGLSKYGLENPSILILTNPQNISIEKQSVSKTVKYLI